MGKKAARVKGEHNNSLKSVKDPMQTNEKYDVVLSFAGENRDYVDAVAEFLKKNDVKVFYDKYEEVALWGKDLAVHFSEIYGKEGRYCIPFISKSYAAKAYPIWEMNNALSKAIMQKVEYILPARFDNTDIPGLRPTIAYIDLSDKTPEEFGQIILQKLKETLDKNIEVPDETEKSSEKIQNRKINESNSNHKIIDKDKLAEIIVVIKEEYLKISPESMRLKLKGFNLNDGQKNQIIETILTDIESLRSLSKEILEFLSNLFPQPYEDFWRKQENGDILLSILKDGPIHASWVMNLKLNQWTLSFEKLSNSIQKMFGFSNGLMNFVWEKFLKGKITFVYGEFSTQDPTKFDEFLQALAIQNQQKKEAHITKEEELYSEIQKNWIRYQNTGKISSLKKAMIAVIEYNEYNKQLTIPFVDSIFYQVKVAWAQHLSNTKLVKKILKIGIPSLMSMILGIWLLSLPDLDIIGVGFVLISVIYIFFFVLQWFIQYTRQRTPGVVRI